MDPSDADKSDHKAANGPAQTAAKTAREAKLAKALRVNLRRRKQGSDRPPPSGA